MKAITAGKLNKIMQQNRYVLLRDGYNNLYGFNCRISNIAKRLKPFNPKIKTNYYSYSPCSFNEYLNHKIPFVLPNITI